MLWCIFYYAEALQLLRVIETSNLVPIPSCRDAENGTSFNRWFSCSQLNRLDTILAGWMTGARHKTLRRTHTHTQIADHIITAFI